MCKLALTSVILLYTLIPATVSPAPTPGDSHFFAETGHTVKGSQPLWPVKRMGAINPRPYG
jgi:hypothetical protein